MRIRFGWENWPAARHREIWRSASAPSHAVSLIAAFEEGSPGNSVRNTALWSDPPSHCRRGNFLSITRPSHDFQTPGLLMHCYPRTNILCHWQKTGKHVGFVADMASGQRSETSGPWLVKRGQ